jgi:AcrR family transcriptional regulator
MPRKIDRRVQRTKKLLRESMLNLIMERGYDEINIQDVTDKANLGRATFYLHYKEKDDLLADVMQQLMEEFLLQSPQLVTTQWRLDDTRGIQKLFKFAEANYDFYRIMVIGKGAATASRQLHQIVAANIQQALENEIALTNAEPILPVTFMADHFAGALISTILWWLDTGMPYTAEEMAFMYQQVSLLSRDQLLKLPEPRGAVAAFIEESIDRVRNRDKKKPKREKNRKGQDSSDREEIHQSEEGSTIPLSLDQQPTEIMEQEPGGSTEMDAGMRTQPK